MISQKLIKKFAKKNKKKLSKKAIVKINKILEEKLKIIIFKSSRNADFAGRIVINENDVRD